MIGDDWKFETSSLLRLLQFGFNSIHDYFPGSLLFAPKLQQAILNCSFVNVLGFGSVLMYLVELEREGWGRGLSFSHDFLILGCEEVLVICLYVG